MLTSSFLRVIGSCDMQKLASDYPCLMYIYLYRFCDYFLNHKCCSVAVSMPLPKLLNYVDIRKIYRKMILPTSLEQVLKTKSYKKSSIGFNNFDNKNGFIYLCCFVFGFLFLFLFSFITHVYIYPLFKNMILPKKCEEKTICVVQTNITLPE